MNKMNKKKERTRCEVYSRVVGYLRPVRDWNLGKQEEFKDRKTYKIKKESKVKSK
jgi:anaerobic ribonucleoside-triphosphate reductase